MRHLLAAKNLNTTPFDFRLETLAHQISNARMTLERLPYGSLSFFILVVRVQP